MMYRDVAALGHPWPTRHLCFLHVANAVPYRDVPMPRAQDAQKRPRGMDAGSGPGSNKLIGMKIIPLTYQMAA
jgi:hypothetical protein